MKLFLTGERDAGKTYIVDAALRRWQEAGRGPVLGFRTFKQEAPDGTALIRLTSPAGGALYTVGSFSGGKRTVFPKIFDEVGVGLLADVNEARRGIVLMDELGFIESDAPIFQREVLRVLALPLPIIGVLRAQSSPFLDSLRARGDITLVTVTVDTRAGVAERCFSLLGLQNK